MAVPDGKAARRELLDIAKPGRLWHIGGDAGIGDGRQLAALRRDIEIEHHIPDRVGEEIACRLHVSRACATGPVYRLAKPGELRVVQHVPCLSPEPARAR